MSEHLGKYEIIEELGRGGFATVYRALDTTLNRQVALKILHPRLLSDPGFVARFQREAQALASLRHPNIVTVHEVAEADDRLYIAMELASGPSLEHVIKERGRLPWVETLALLEPICAALDYAHAQGIIHRDLKPSNILLDRERIVLLTDFGFARLMGESSMSMSLSGGILGTPAYIAPEVWEQDAAGVGADIYALGCIVHEMLTGGVLFGGQTPMQSMRAHDRGPQFPQPWPEGVPEGIVAPLGKALARDPAARYPNASALRYALADLEKGAQAAREAAEQAAVAAEWRQEAETAMAAGEWSAARMAVARWLALAPNDPAALRARQEVEEQLRAASTVRQEPTPPARQGATSPQTQPAVLAPVRHTPEPSPARQPQPIPAAKPKRLSPWAWAAVAVLGLIIILAARNVGQGAKPTPIIVESEMTVERIVKETVVVEGIAAATAVSPESSSTAISAAAATGAPQTSSTSAPKPPTATPQPPASTPIPPTVQPTNTPIPPTKPSVSPSHTPSRAYTPTPASTSLPDAVISHTTLNLRAGPGDDYSVVGNYPQGTGLELLGKEATETWVKVRAPDGSLGWMYLPYLTTNIRLDSLEVVAAPPPPTPRDAAVRIVAENLDSITAVARFSTQYRMGMDISPDGRLLATTGWAPTVYVFDWQTEQLVAQIPETHPGGASAIRFSPDGKRVAWGRVNDHRAILYRLQNWQEDAHFDMDASTGWHVHGIAFSPAGDLLAVTSDDPMIRVWSLSEYNEILALERPAQAVDQWQDTWRVDFSWDGRLLASSGTGSVRIWQIPSGSLYWDIPDAHGPIASSPTRDLIAGLSSHGDILLLNTETQQVEAKLDNDSGNILAIAFSPDGQLLAAGTADGQLRFWQVLGGVRLRTVLTQFGAVNEIAFSKDGSTLATRSYEEGLTVWAIP